MPSEEQEQETTEGWAFKKKQGRGGEQGEEWLAAIF